MGLIIGLPQGLQDLPSMANSMPKETIQIIGGFGAIAGFMFGIMLLSRANKKDYSVGSFCFFCVGSLSIGIPNVIRHYENTIIEDITMPGLFFSSVGLAMLLGGLLGHFFGKPNQQN